MNIKNLLFASLFLLSHFLLAQKKTYNIPEFIETDQTRITFQKVSVSSSSYFVHYKAQNLGNGVLIIDRSLTSLEQNEGVIYAISDKYILRPGKDKTVYNQFRVKPPTQLDADLLTLKIDGFSYANPSTPLKAEKLVLAEKATQNIDQFAIKVQEYHVYSDRIYASIKCTFNGDVNSLGGIDLTKLIVNGGKVDIVKKGDVVFSGKSYSFSINIAPNGEELSVNFNEVLQVMALEKIAFDPVKIKSTDYVEPTEDVKSEDSNTDKPATEKAAELSFSDFMALRKDIELEMNNEGGKPIAMANEFIAEKGGISTAQVLEILTVFNLDGHKLKFAKMAYPFTSDKPKYHQVVGKLGYVKNKQALEEFLEEQ